MNARIEYQSILENGEPRFAVVPIEQFRERLQKSGEAEAIILNEVVSATAEGASPARAWREHLDLSQQAIAERMSITQPAYAQMEAPSTKLRNVTRERIAKALGLLPKQLDF